MTMMIFRPSTFKQSIHLGLASSALLLLLVLSLSQTEAYAPSSPLFGSHRSHRQTNIATTPLQSTSTPTSNTDIPNSSKIEDIKKTLLTSIKQLKAFQARDGDFSIDFGVKGGELNSTSRAPQKVNFYGISKDVGQAADEVLSICNSLSPLSPISEPTQYLGNPVNGTSCPLNGPWKLLFTTAADASFSSNSTRGAAKAQNIVDASKGRITNVIDFANKDDGTPPVLQQLNVIIRATAASKTRVELQFRYAKAVLNKFFFFPLFGRQLTLYIPVPAAFITRCIVFLGRLIRLGRKSREGVKAPPKAYFDVLYLDKDLRIHKTGEDNIFVQARDSWEAARPLFE